MSCKVVRLFIFITTIQVIMLAVYILYSVQFNWLKTTRQHSKVSLNSSIQNTFTQPDSISTFLNVNLLWKFVLTFFNKEVHDFSETVGENNSNVVDKARSDLQKQLPGTTTSKTSDLPKQLTGNATSKTSDLQKQLNGTTTSKTSDLQKQSTGNATSERSDLRKQLTGNTTSERSDLQKQLTGKTTSERSELQKQLTGNATSERSDLHKQLTGNATRGRLNINATREPEVFQTVDLKESWLYSAFYDQVAAEKGKPVIRIIGIVRGEWRKPVYCSFSTEDGIVNSTGIFITLPDSHNRNYLPCYLDCLLPNNVRPTHVSASYQTKEKPTNRLQIIYPGPRIRNFTVCYSVLHSNYDQAFHLIDSIELNRILGAEHFMVYNLKTSKKVLEILTEYENDGIVTTLQWQLPTYKTWYYAQITALNDCFYRNRNVSRFVVVVDTDEFIVPASHYSWMDLIHSLSPLESDIVQPGNMSQPADPEMNRTGCFLFMSCFFTIYRWPKWDSLPREFQFTESEQKMLINHNILSLSQFVRLNKPFPHYKRSKYIARPELVDASGIHFVENFTSPMSCFEVNESMALAHHHRKPNMGRWTVMDFSTLKYKSVLYPRIVEQIKRFFG